MKASDDLAHTDALLARLLKLTSRKEDFLTECFAAVLQADRRAASDHLKLLGAQLTRAQASTPISEVRTQCRFNSGAERCDLVLKSGRLKIAVEHKLEAVQGRDQLLRYLSLPKNEVTHVAFIASDYQTVPSAVVSNKRFLRPSSGQPHFVWADVYPLLERSKRRGVEVAIATCGLFDRLGLQPAHPLIGFLHTQDSTRRFRLDAKLYASWQPLLRSLRRKWEYADSSIRKDRRSEIYISYGPSNLLRRVWLDPFSNPGSLRIRLRTDTQVKRDLIFERIDSVKGRATIPGGRYLAIVKEPISKYKQEYPWSVEVRIGWRVLLSRSTEASLPLTLKRFVIGLMGRVDSRAV